MLLRLYGAIILVTSVFAADFDIVYSLTRSDIANTAIAYSYSPNADLGDIPTWLSTLKSDGSWPDIDYTTGCSADLNIWKAEEHWARVIGMAQAWSGLNSGASPSYANSTGLFGSTQSALQYWFTNDYQNDACLQANGTGQCPCGTSGLWNKNWFFQGIGVPTLAGRACLLLGPGPLTTTQRNKCLEMSIRGSNFSSTPLRAAYQTGSNLVNILQSVIAGALFSGNNSLLADAYGQAMSTFADGQHIDGSHLAHTSQLYNGAYGREFLKSFVSLQNDAAGTQFQASPTIQTSIAALLRGSDWQIFRDSTGSLRWDISVIGRYVASPLSPPGNTLTTLQLDTNSIQQATSSFSGSNTVSDTLSRLSQSSGAPALLGNKAFWRGDYMVHRRDGYTLFNKMISSRSRQAETVGGSNKYGYHVNQGSLYSWVSGDEYTNITGSWDWYLIPGSTVLDHYPTLDISWISVTGKRPFVGMASDGQNGVSVMDYIEPHDASISYRRAWFYYDDMVINVISNASSLTTVSSAPILHVLDQRRADGSSLSLNGKQQSSNTVTASTKTILYGGNGYYAMNGGSFALTARQESRTGNWSELSNTAAGQVTQDIFTAYHTMPNASTIAYAYVPRISASDLATRANGPTGALKVINSTGVIGIAGNKHLALTFWPNAAKIQQIQMPAIGWKTSGSITITTTAPGIFMFDIDSSGVMTVQASDPTQTLTTISLTLKADTLNIRCDSSASYCSQLTNGVTFALALPTGAYAGSTMAVKASTS